MPLAVEITRVGLLHTSHAVEVAKHEEHVRKAVADHVGGVAELQLAPRQRKVRQHHEGVDSVDEVIGGVAVRGVGVLWWEKDAAPVQRHDGDRRGHRDAVQLLQKVGDALGGGWGGARGARGGDQVRHNDDEGPMREKRHVLAQSAQGRTGVARVPMHERAEAPHEYAKHEDSTEVADEAQRAWRDHSRADNPGLVRPGRRAWHELVELAELRLGVPGDSAIERGRWSVWEMGAKLG